ncbi:MAG: rhodanese-like domain-containing protein [Micromonosporaceae bacterium]
MVAVISRDELKQAIAAGEVSVVDALGGAYYEAQHLPGAVPLAPGDAVAQAASVLPDKAAAIVTYCSNPACPNSGQVATTLLKLGYTNVRKYRDGIEDWVSAGLPVETAASAEQRA